MISIALNQRGNALFLILIAVALFAALGYAISDSTRGGSGGVERETALLHAAQITQYAAGLSTTVNRMTLTGTDVTAVELCGGGDFCATSAVCTTGSDCVFAPEGGGFTVVNTPSIAKTAATEDSYYEENILQMDGVGTTATDAVFMASVLTQSICEEINKGLGLSISPVETDVNGILDLSVGGYTGEPFKCVDNGSGVYYYFHTLIER